MPAMLDDPTAPTIYRTSGGPPFPVPNGPLPPDILPRAVTLRDRVTIATLVPFSSPAQVPPKLMATLCDLLNREIEKGDTYPMIAGMPLSSFGPYWFQNFGAIMFMGDIQSVEEVTQMEARGVDWGRECLGSFYVKPNYPGRSSHVCNGGFLVTDAARNRGVGRLMGEGYLEWAPKLGYSYSVFNLVYETNVASLRIWDALGFKRIGRVKGCGNLKSYPDQLIDAIIFGRELGGEGDEYVTEERFDKIRFYLKNGTYPAGSDRAEKSRLRSAATHYRLVPNPDGAEGDEEKLMLKGKEVISDPHKQYEIARTVHINGHGGINKTTASIAEKYHWVRIKETVSAAIRNCPECKDTTGPSTLGSARRSNSQTTGGGNSNNNGNNNNGGITSTAGRKIAAAGSSQDQAAQGQAGVSSANHVIVPHQQHQQQQPQHQHQQQQPEHQHQQQQQHQQQHHAVPMAQMQYPSYTDLPVDPQIMSGMHHWEAPAHLQQQQSQQHQHHQHQQHQQQLQQGGDDVMNVDVDRLHGADRIETDEQLGSRLREELAAQMLSQDGGYGDDMRERR